MATLIHPSPAVGRNSRCACGSGRKHKHCCLLHHTAPASPANGSRFSAEHRQQARALAHSNSPRDLHQACLSLRSAIQLAPHLPDPINDLGVLLARLHRPEAALTCYQQAIALDPCHALAHSNLGALFNSLGRHSEAIASLTTALRSKPGFADAHINLSAALIQLGRYAEAIDHAQSALTLLPNDLEALLNLGNAFKHQGRYTLAAASYEQAFAAHPADPRSLINLGDTLRDHAAIPDAEQAYRLALQLQPANPSATTTIWSNRLYLHAFAHDLPPEVELDLARRYEHAILTPQERAAAAAAASPASGVFNTTPLIDRPLRLGIVSAELGAHAVAEFLQPFLEHLDRSRFHLTLLPTTLRSDSRAHQINSLANDILPIHHLSDTDALTLVRRHAIDVLIDTSGHTAGNRLGLFARRAAPVQCTWIGYWNSTGLSQMDYALADSIAPPNAHLRFSEKLWRLPRLNVSYRGDPALRIDWTPATDGTLRLGSFNKFSKLREDTLALWANVLHALPNARLLLEDRGTDETDSHLRIRSNFATHGIAPGRIEFLPHTSATGSAHARHMLRYNRIDIALDTVPFNSGTTAYDALWMGLPLVTLEGDWTGGRIAAGVLRTLGHPEWIATDPASFTAIVCDLARNIELRRHLRLTQRDRFAASPLCDAPGLTRTLEHAFTAMYNRWLEGPTLPTPNP